MDFFSDLKNPASLHKLRCRIKLTLTLILTIWLSIVSTSHLTVGKKVKGIVRYLQIKANGPWPRLINLEVTKYCNAQCDFCPCWTIKGYPQLQDYSPILAKFRPIVLSLNGGEPLLRKDILDIVRSCRPYCTYMTMITHGQLLTEEKFMALCEAGLDQVCISLNYNNERHDQERKIPGLYQHFSELVPKLTAQGHDNICFNTVIMEQNLEEILPLAHQARAWGAKISFSSYSALKNCREDYRVRESRLTRLEEIISELIALKKEHGHILASEYYLREIPRYFREGHMDDCQAGLNFVQITPDGMIKRCSEMDEMCHWTEYNPDEIEKPNPCNVCWLSCRGETETPISPSRLLEFVAK